MLKKLSALFISAVLLVSVFMISANADAGGPIFYEYDAVVTDADGADLLTADFGYANSVKFTLYTHADSGVKLTVTGSYQYGDTEYAVAQYYGRIVYVDLSSITAADTFIGEEETVDYDKPFKIKVLNEAGIPLRRGPASAFELVKTIPVGTEIECAKGVAEYPEVSQYSYVTYKDFSGWIYSYPGETHMNFGVLPENAEDAILCVIGANTKLYTGPDSKTEPLEENIPIGTELNYEYYVTREEMSSPSYFTEFEDQKGWIVLDTDDDIPAAIQKEDFGLYFIESFNAYESFENDDEKTAELTPGQIYQGDYSFWKTYPSDGFTEDAETISEYWVRLNAADKKLWIDAESKPLSYIKLDVCSVYTANTDLMFYTEHSSSSDIAATVSSGDSFYCFGNVTIDDVDWMLCVVDSELVWRPADQTDTYYTFDDHIFCSYDDVMKLLKDGANPDPAETQEDAQQENTEKAKGEQASKRALSPMTLALLCIAATVVAALTAIVLVILIKKSKKEN